MSNLLDKASIILTPTAYDDGKVLAAKPSEAPYGDFDFTRNSSATRVNAQGLVEDVQILSSNLVQNGDFSEIGSEEVSNGNFSQIGSEEVSNGDFSQEGSELITNGDFSNGLNNWSDLDGVVTVVDGSALFTINGGLGNHRLRQTIGMQQNAYYKATYTISENIGNARLRIFDGATYQYVPSTVGTHTVIQQRLGTNTAFYFNPHEGTSITIDNVSVKEVGQDWVITSGSGWSIGEDKAVCDNSGSGSRNLRQNNIVTIGKTYKITLDADITSGFPYLIFGGTTAIDSGTNTFYKVATSTDIQIRNSTNNFIGSITNISVKEVGQDWTLGDWEISENKATCDASGGSALTIQQQDILTSGKTYKITYTILDYVQGVLRFRSSPVSGSYTSGNGEHTVYIVAQNTTFGLQGLNGFIGSITNISVKEVLQDWTVKDYGAVNPSAVITPYTEGVKLEKTVSADWRSSFLVQPFSYTNGSKYKVTFKLKNGNLPSGGSVFVRAAYDSSSQNIASALSLTNDWVEYIYYFVASNNSEDISFGEVNWQNAGVGQYFYVDDVSIIEITDDTNLPRINYSGFTYQDSLGSELVTNGDFSDGSTDWTLSGIATIGNGVASFVDDGNNINSAVTQSNIISINKTYKVTFDVVRHVLGGVQLRVGNATAITNQLIQGVGSYTMYINSGPTSGSPNLQIKRWGGLVGWDFDIDNISVKEYLGQEVVPDSGCGAWLFEPQRTNLITDSNDLFATSNAIVLANDAISPDGTQNAQKVTSTSTTGVIARTDIANFADTSSFSLFLKYGSQQWVQIISASSSQLYVNVDIQSGVFGDNGARTENLSIEDYGNGWYRVSGTFTLAQSATTLRIYFISASNSNYAGSSGITVGSYLHTYGWQLEEGSYATSYIPTEGTIKTRNQDLCNNGGDASLINSSEGVLYAQISALTDDLTKRSIALSDGGSANRVLFRYDNVSNKIRVYVLSGGIIEGSLTFIVSDILDFLKIAVKYKENDFALWINGIKVDTDTSGTTPIGLNTLEFANGNGGEFFYGNTKALGVWKEALTDAELRSLTYPTPTAPTFDLDFNTIATDFTFTRNSEATFVNAQGLIQSTNEFGAEEVTNGDFAISGTPSTSTYSLGWYSNTANVSITNGTLILTNSASESSSRAYITDGASSTNVLTENKSYKLQYEIVANNGVSSLNFYLGATGYNAPFTVGEHIIYFESGSNTVFQFRNRTTNSNIVFDNVSIKEYITETNTPRLDYSTGAEAFLLEPQRLNNIYNSNNASTLLYASNVIKSNNSGISPDGNNNAISIIASSVSGVHRAGYAGGNNGSFPVNSILSFSMFVKSNGVNYVAVGGFFSSESVVFDLINGTVVSESANVLSSKIQSLANGWFRVTSTYNFQNTIGNQLPYVGVLLMQNSTSQGAWTGNDVDGILAYGFQLEEGSYPTSYIPTYGESASGVTRNQELCYDATPVINSEEGVLYAEISKQMQNNDVIKLISLNGGSNDDDSVTIGFLTGNNIYARVKANGVNQLLHTSFSSNANQFYKVALKYKSGNISLWINGVEIATSTSTFSFNLPLSELSFDFNGNNGLPFFGNTKDLKVYPKALSDVELQDLTTI